MKKPKNVFYEGKVIEGPEAPGVVIDRFLFKFHSNKVLFRFLTYGSLLGSSLVLSDRLFFRVLSNRFFSWSPVLFFWHAALFFSKCATTLFIKSRRSVLHYVCKKKIKLKANHLKYKVERESNLFSTKHYTRREIFTNNFSWRTEERDRTAVRNNLLAWKW